MKFLILLPLPLKPWDCRRKPSHHHAWFPKCWGSKSRLGAQQESTLHCSPEGLFSDSSHCKALPCLDFLQEDGSSSNLLPVPSGFLLNDNRLLLRNKCPQQSGGRYKNTLKACLKGVWMRTGFTNTDRSTWEDVYMGFPHQQLCSPPNFWRLSGCKCGDGSIRGANVIF